MEIEAQSYDPAVVVTVGLVMPMAQDLLQGRFHRLVVFQFNFTNMIWEDYNHTPPSAPHRDFLTKSQRH